MTLPGAAGSRFNVYSSQNMGWQGSLLTGHTRTSSAQDPPQDSYEFDVDARLIAVNKLGSKVQEATP